MNNKLMYLTGIIAFSFWHMISYLSSFIPFDLRLRAMTTTPFSDTEIFLLRVFLMHMCNQWQFENFSFYIITSGFYIITQKG